MNQLQATDARHIIIRKRKNRRRRRKKRNRKWKFENEFIVQVEADGVRRVSQMGVNYITNKLEQMDVKI
jgi:hypothetical protein